MPSYELITFQAVFQKTFLIALKEAIKETLQETIQGTLQKTLKQSFRSADNFIPGDEDVEYDLEESREWISYALSSLKDARGDLEKAIERLSRVDCTIEKKIGNAYHEPDYEAVFN